MTVTEQDRQAFAHHVLVNPEHRFIFFTIPKVACTEWIKLFLRMQGANDWRADPHSRDDRPFLANYSAAECTEMLTHPDWTRAVFFRDPVERLLSAYLDKFLYRQSYIVELFGDPNRKVSLDEFLDFVLDPNTDPANPRGLHAGTNPHWRPQSLVGNVEKFIGQINFIGRFDRLHSEAKDLLRRHDLWRKFGKDSWDDRGSIPFIRGAMFQTNKAWNRTGARARLDEFFTPELQQRIRNAYRQDYELFERLGLDDMSSESNATLQKRNQ